MTKTLTIFTPTYNRAYILPKLYESLCSQTCKDFVWIVVDDGSTDNTQEMLTGWEKEAIIDICYKFQKNGGKMRAHNRAVEMADTELFVCVDSDDQLASPTAVEDNLKFWALQKERKFNGLVSYYETSGLISFKEIGEKKFTFPDNIYCSSLYGLYESGFCGETTLMFRTKVLRDFPFPEIEGENFITESVAYDMIDTKYKLILFPYYTQKCEYREDGYTKNLSLYNWKNPKGYRLYYNQRMKYGIGNLSRNVRDYIFYSLIVNDWKTISLSTRPIITIVYYPVGVLKYIKKRIQYLSYRNFK